MKRHFGKIVSVVLLATAPLVSNAFVFVKTEYAVSDAISSHGLWTGNDFFNGDRSFNIQDDTRLFTYSDDTARLVGTAEDSGVTWALDILFEDFTTTPGTGTNAPKTGGGPVLPSWEYYETITGTITRTDVASGPAVDVSRTGPAFQVGFGANDKTPAFGASAWLKAKFQGNDKAQKRHWDINVNLTEVSAPGSIGLILVGFLGLVAARRRTAK